MAKPNDHKSKKASRVTDEHWKTEPDDHDYPAAGDYLSLLLPGDDVHELVGALRDAPLVHRKAKDLLRASRLPLLAVDNFHVADDLSKVRRGERLSPVLLIRGDVKADVALTVADGYHRICASYHLSENADIPCRLVEWPQAASVANNAGDAGADTDATAPRPPTLPAPPAAASQADGAIPEVPTPTVG